MTKYRRKAANAKERDRMKHLNEAFDRLRSVMPDVKTLTLEDKDTKVTTLRAAITYIESLKQLMEDLDEGKVGPEDYEMDEDDSNFVKIDPNDAVESPSKNKIVKKKSQSQVRLGEVFLSPHMSKKRQVNKVTLSHKHHVPTLRRHEPPPFFTDQPDNHQHTGNGHNGHSPNLLTLQPLPLHELYPYKEDQHGDHQTVQVNVLGSEDDLYQTDQMIGRRNTLQGDKKSDSIDGDNPESPDSIATNVDTCEDMSDSGDDSNEVPTPTKLIPTIDQLFKRSFSYELEELARSCGGEQYILLDQLVNTCSGDNLLILDDIHSIINIKEN